MLRTLLLLLAFFLISIPLSVGAQEEALETQVEFPTYLYLTETSQILALTPLTTELAIGCIGDPIDTKETEGTQETSQGLECFVITPEGISPVLFENEGGGDAVSGYVGSYYTVASATTTKHVFDNRGVLLATVDGNGSATTTSFAHNDHLGSVTVTTDEDGDVLSARDYHPFGSERVSTGDPLERAFIGERLDTETELNYLNSRYYRSLQGQFLSQDPIFWGNPANQNLENPQSLNSYSYGENNPINKSDPTGKCPQCIIGAGAGMLGQYGYDVYNNISANGFSASAFYSGLSSPETYAVRAIQGAIVGGTGGLAAAYGITAQIGAVGLASGLTGAGGNYALGEVVSWQSFAADTVIGGLTFGAGKLVPGVPGRLPDFGTNAWLYGKHTQQSALQLGIGGISDYTSQLIGSHNFTSTSQDAAKAIGVGNTGSGNFVGTYNFGPGAGTYDFGKDEWVSGGQSTPATSK
ncbi:MAG: RHS repeat-associated core domain-containing protein [Parcubacteria group bacterium]|nr:RHS repeat-associated core domain-containing protein [Parcubacteria group bacterium]